MVGSEVFTLSRYEAGEVVYITDNVNDPSCDDGEQMTHPA